MRALSHAPTSITATPPVRPWYRNMKTASVLSLLAAIAALVVLSAQGAHGQVAVPCEGLTRLPYCTECARPQGAATPLCYLCHPSRASVWKTDGTGTVSQVGMTCSRGNKGAATSKWLRRSPAGGSCRRLARP